MQSLLQSLAESDIPQKQKQQIKSILLLSEYEVRIDHIVSVAREGIKNEF